MIRFINPDNIYYSLDDVVNWLCDEQVITKRQGRSFTYHCYQYITNELAKAYRTKAVFSHLVPIILPFGDYFINWIVWANLLILLPELAGRHAKVHELNLLLDDPESIHTHPALFKNLDLIPVSKRLQ